MTRSRTTSHQRRPVTASSTSPSALYPTFEYRNRSPGGQPAGVSRSSQTSWVASPVASPDDPQVRIKDRYHAPDGRDYPLLIQGLVRDPITMTSKAKAIYYDGQSRRWRDITDTDTRVALAREVEAGRLKVTVDWDQQL